MEAKLRRKKKAFPFPCIWDPSKNQVSQRKGKMIIRRRENYGRFIDKIPLGIRIIFFLLDSKEGKMRNREEEFFYSSALLLFSDLCGRGELWKKFQFSHHHFSDVLAMIWFQFPKLPGESGQPKRKSECPKNSFSKSNIHFPHISSALEKSPNPTVVNHWSVAESKNHTFFLERKTKKRNWHINWIALKWYFINSAAWLLVSQAQSELESPTAISYS